MDLLSLIPMLCFKCWHTGQLWHGELNGLRATALSKLELTERRGVEAGHRAGHEEVSDLSEGQQAGGVVPFPLLLLDQTLQLLLEGLRDKTSEKEFRKEIM